MLKNVNYTKELLEDFRKSENELIEHLKNIFQNSLKKTYECKCHKQLNMGECYCK